MATPHRDDTHAQGLIDEAIEDDRDLDERWTPGPVHGRAPQGHCPHCGEPLPVIIDGKCPNCEIPVDVDDEAEDEDAQCAEVFDERDRALGHYGGDTEAFTPMQRPCEHTCQYFHFGTSSGMQADESDEPMSDEDDDREFDPEVERAEPCPECEGTQFRAILGNRVQCQTCGGVYPA